MDSRRVLQALNRGRRKRPSVVLGLAGFVVAVYVLVVLGGGVLIGRTDSPSVALSVLATAAVALLFAPAQTALERAATRLWGGGAVLPYDVLSRFSETVTGGCRTEDLPACMSMLLARGTGAKWAQVWLTVGDRLTLAATWPADVGRGASPPDPQPGARDATGEGRRALAVQHGGQVLGVLRLQERRGLPLTAVEERLFAGLAAQAGLALRAVALRAELGDRHEELVTRVAELKASRARLIEAQNAERRRLERDVHDGAQQHLVALTVNLRLAETIAARSPERAARVLSEQADAADDAIETLSCLSRGIYPRLLAERGVVPALRSAVATSPIPVSIETGDVGRLPAEVEAALYFCCMEAVQNAAKHSGASSVSVRLGEDRAGWHVTIVDDGAGFDPQRAVASRAGSGLVNMSDRLDALGGAVTVRSFSNRGTTVTAVVPRTAQGEPGAPGRTVVPPQAR